MIELRKMNDGEKWTCICEKYGTIFHTLDWIDIIEKVFNAEKILLGIYEDGMLKGIFPLYRVKSYINLLMSPLHGSSTPYGGPIIRTEEFLIENYSKIFRELHKFVELEDIDIIEIKLHPPLSYHEYEFLNRVKYDLDITYNSGYEFEDKYTVILNLDKSKEELWRNLNKKCRNAIRKAEKKGVYASELSLGEILEDYYKMEKDVYDKSFQPPAKPKTFYLKVYEVLRNKKQIKVMGAYHKGKLIAGAFFLLYRDTIYFWDGVSYRDYLNVAPNNLIQWKLIEWACENEYKIYDMIGAGISGIGKFKLSFGGKIVTSLKLRKYNSLLTKITAKTYENIFPIYRRWCYRIKNLKISAF